MSKGVEEFPSVEETEVTDDLEPKDPSPWTKWCKSSPQALKESEEKIFSLLRRGSEFSGRYVEADSNVRIWTRELEPIDNSKYLHPLVMIHGMGAGMALYGANAEILAEDKKVILIDLPGFARSSRPEFSVDPVECEAEYVHYIELWREKMGLSVMNLLGHSFGGFISASYALKYPSRVKNLILADPWGMPLPPRVRGLGYIVENVLDFASQFTPLLSLRVSGTLGLTAIKWVKSNLLVTWKKMFDSEDESILAEYFYHCNSQKPTGECAFTYLNEMFIWAQNPLIPRLKDLNVSVNLTTVYGEHSWIMKLGKDGLEEVRNECHGYNKLEVVENGGHHLFLDNPEQFSEFVNNACCVH